MKLNKSYNTLDVIPMKLAKVLFAFIFLIATYSLISYIKYDFVAFDFFEKAHSKGISFDDVLRLKNHELVNPVHFKVNKSDDIFVIDTEDKSFKYLTIHVNYLSVRNTPIEIGYISSAQPLVRDVYLLRPGINVYKLRQNIPIDRIAIKSADDVTYVVGISGLSVDGTFSYKTMPLILATTLILLLILCKIKRFREWFACFAAPAFEYGNAFKAYFSQNLMKLVKVLFAFIFLIATYSLISYIKYDFVAFDFFEKAHSKGISFDDVLRLKNHELVNPVHFKVNKSDDIFVIDTEDKSFKYLTIHVNYLSVRNTPIEIGYISSAQPLVRDVYLLRPGINVYKLRQNIPIDRIAIKSADDVTYVVGISGLSVDGTFSYKTMPLILATTLILLLILCKIKRFREWFACFAAPAFEYGNALKAYFSLNVVGVLFVMVLTAASFGFMVTNFTLSIDEELEMMGPRDIGWIGYGRFGTYFLNKLFLVNERVTPFFTDFSAALLLGIAAILFVMNFAETVGHKARQPLLIAIFGGLFLSVPLVIGEYMSFGVYNMALGLGYVLVAASIYFSARYCLSRKFNDLFWAVSPLFIAISIYQSFIGLYVTCVIFSLLLFFVKGSHSCVWRDVIVKAVFHFFILTFAVGLYLLLNKYFQATITPAYGYVGNIVGWGKGVPLLEVVATTFQKVVSILMGKGDDSGVVILFTTFAFGLYLVAKLICLKSISQALMFIVLGLSFIISPFILMLALGASLPGRALQALPFFIAGAWYLMLMFPISNSVKFISIGLSSYLIFIQLQFLNSMFYGDYLRFQQDQFLGRRIMSTLESEAIDYKKRPLVFIGSRKLDSSFLISKTNSGGKSFFEDQSQMYRMTYFLGSLGYNVITPTYEEMAEGKMFSNEMSIWPNPNGVKISNNLIIVKLSEILP